MGNDCCDTIALMYPLNPGAHRFEHAMDPFPLGSSAIVFATLGEDDEASFTTSVIRL